MEGCLLLKTYEGESFVEVPDGYEKVCGKPNGGYDERLEDGSYLISPDFTAFLGFDSEGTVLIYSEDQGTSWNQSRITNRGYKANTFLSRNEGGYAAVFAVDRALGNDYYGTWMSDDLKTWTLISTEDQVMSNVSAAFWADDQTGCYAAGQEQSVFYRTTDRGTTFREIPLPQATEAVEKLGFNPFDQVERFYIEDGMWYMVIGQGEDGDYADNGQMIIYSFPTRRALHLEIMESLAKQARGSI